MLSNDRNQFWTEYWKDVDALDSGKGTPADVLRRISQIAETQTDKQLSAAWAAHVMIASSHIYCPNWERQVACLALMKACHDNFPSEAVLELLIPDALHCLHNSGDPRGRLVLLDLIESLLPNILGAQDYSKYHKDLNSAEPSKQALAAVDRAVARWTSLASIGTSDVSPIVLASNSDNDFLQETTTKAVGLHELLDPQPPFPPPFARPLPPNLDIIEGGYRTPEEEQLAQQQLCNQLQWLVPTNLRLMLIPDDDDADTDNREVTMQPILSNAITGPLQPSDQRTLLDYMTTGRNALQLVHSILTPDSLPRLVEHNPNVAYECLVQLLKNDTNESAHNDYLSSLVNMTVSLHSMEVVHRLATQTNPPLVHAEYVQLYINACLAACDAAAAATPGAANIRLVRLVCVWIQSLLRNDIVEVDDIFWQVQAFCVEHSKVREASALYKSLQSTQKKPKPKPKRKK